MDEDEIMQPDDYYQVSLGLCDNDIMLLDIVEDEGVYIARLFGDDSGREWEFLDRCFKTKEEAFRYGKARIKAMKEFFENLNLRKIRMPR